MITLSAPLPNKQRFAPIEAAIYLGVSVKTIYRWIDNGKLKAVKVGDKLIKISREEIIEIQKEIY